MSSSSILSRRARRLLPPLLLALALLVTRPWTPAGSLIDPGVARWRTALVHGFPPRPRLAELNAALETGDSLTVADLMTRGYTHLPGLFRAILAARDEAEAVNRPDRAAGPRRAAAWLEASYRERFHQETLTKIRVAHERLTPAERPRWARLDRMLQCADTLQTYNRWAETDSLGRVAAAGFEALGDRFGAGRAWARAGAAATSRGYPARGAQEAERALTLLADCAAPFEVGRTGHNLATAYEALGDYAQAERTLERVYQVAPEISGPHRVFVESDARSLEARLRLDRGRFPEALALYEAARHSSQLLAAPAGEAGDLLNLAQAHALTGQLELALAEVDTSIALCGATCDGQSYGGSLNVRGGLLIQLGRLPEAAVAYRMAADQFRALDSPQGLGEALSGQGRLCGLRGDFPAGRALLERALALARQYGDARHESDYLTGLGTLSLECGQYRVAHDYFMEALTHARAVGLTDGQIEALLALGRIEQRLARPEEAIARYASALELARTAGRSGGEIAVQLEQAELALNVRTPDEAERLAREAGNHARACGAEGLELAALVLQARGQLAMGRLDEAAERLAAARDRPSLADYPLVAFDLEWTAARVARRAGHLEEADAAYARTTDRLDDLTDRASMAELRAGLLTSRYVAYREAVALRLERGDMAGAFERADHARGRSLVERLNRLESPAASPALPDTTGAGLREDLRTLTDALAREERGRASAVVMAALRGRVADTRRALETRRAWRDTGSPRPSPGTRPVAASLSELRARLRPGSAFVEFCEGEDGWRAFVVRGDSLLLVALPGLERGDTLASRVNAFRGALETDYRTPAAAAGWIAPGAALYDDLWRPLTAALRGARLVYVAAEGALRAVPYSALVSAPGSATGQPALLLESCATAQVPSAATLLLMTRRLAARDSRPGHWLGVAATPVGRPIAGSAVEQEVHAASAVLAWPGTRLLIGAEATEENVAREAPEARWIHFACHARFLREAPRQSWLELAPSRANDGRLEVDEIERLRLKARVVTLSACETAVEGGPGAATGEELIGMSRAFLSAGADAVVASLWPVPDDAVGALMLAFYEELAQEPGTPALALNRAEAGLLASGHVGSRRGHPYLVAAFSVTGAGD